MKLQADRVVARVRELARGLPLPSLPTFRRLKPDLLAPGVYLTRNVRLLRPLSERVWVAEHLTLSTQVVVKFLPPMQAEGEALQREPSMPTPIKDPHIVQVSDHGVTRAGTRFVVMELSGGESLRARLGRTGPLALREVRTIVAQTAGALGKAHASSLVHGEVTPDNLFLTDAAGEPFIKILGFVQPPDPRRMTPETPLAQGGYASPEQLMRGAPADAQADLWALAVSAYELLTGGGPFLASSAAGIAMAVCQGPLRPITRVRQDLPHAMDAWFARALSKDRAHRYRTASEFAQSFAEAAEGHYFVDPDRASALNDDDDQEEQTALWSQPAWWSEEAAALSSRGTPFSSSRSAPTMAFRAVPSTSMPVAGPAPPDDDDDERPLLVPLAAIIVGAAVGLTAALLVWGVQFWPPKPRTEVQIEANRTASTARESGGLHEGDLVDPSVPPVRKGKGGGLASSDVAQAAGRSGPPSIEARVRSLSTLPTAPPDPEVDDVAPLAVEAEPAKARARAAAAPPKQTAAHTASGPRAAAAPPVPSPPPRNLFLTRTKKSAPAGKGDCDPPYYFDAQHIKRVKLQCL